MYHFVGGRLMFSDHRPNTLIKFLLYPDRLTIIHTQIWYVYLLNDGGGLIITESYWFECRFKRLS